MANPDPALKVPWSKSNRGTDLHELSIEPSIRVSEVFRLVCPTLRELLPSEDAQAENVRHHHTQVSGEKTGYTNLMGEGDLVLGDIVRNTRQTAQSRGYVRAGPRQKNYFEPSGVVAGIVTCGGLCPGLNNVIRDIVRALHQLYGVSRVLGFVGGYAGIYERDPVELTIESVSKIHHEGGTMLSSSRGGFDEAKILAALRRHGVNQLYVIGGDGTMRGAHKLCKATVRDAKIAAAAGDGADKSAAAAHRPIAVAGVPKTIDNDIDMIDRSFGFNTAVEEALRAVRAARVEASCVPHGIGIVKLMGRHAGFIAAHAALASGEVDLVLIPEVPIELEGAGSVLDHMRRVLERRGHGVVVVAEGAGEELMQREHVGTDASGNRALPPIGAFLKERLLSHFRNPPDGAAPIDVTVKYIDPSYMIRSVPANASDSLYCMLLGQNAVHGAMAGYTGFCTGLCNNRVVYLPMDAIVANSPRFMNANGRTWERILSLTGQPKSIAPPPKAGSGAVTARTIF